jgi:hypothetical protein
MTPAEKQKRYRERQRNESNALPVTESNGLVTKSVTVTPKSVTTVTTVIPWCDISESRFDGYGRGIPVGGYVMVVMETPKRVDGEFEGGECGVVTEKVWRSRLSEECVHGYSGWKCKPCLAL